MEKSKGNPSFKLYPRRAHDAGGMKFFYNHGGNHYTIRFAGDPMILLEFQFKALGGENFSQTYARAKSGKFDEQAGTLKKAIDAVEGFLSVIDAAYDANKSPFVVYANSFSEFK